MPPWWPTRSPSPFILDMWSSVYLSLRPDNPRGLPCAPQSHSRKNEQPWVSGMIFFVRVDSCSPVISVMRFQWRRGRAFSLTAIPRSAWVIESWAERSSRASRHSPNIPSNVQLPRPLTLLLAFCLFRSPTNRKPPAVLSVMTFGIRTTVRIHST